MEPQELHISARTLMHEILPRLRTTEAFVNDTLQAMIDAAHDPEERARRRVQQQEFQLELQMIWLNMKSLMRRHAGVLHEVQQDGKEGDEVLILDPHEAVAITRARELCARLRDWHSG